MELDSMDKNILKNLQRDCRVSNRQIARNLDLSVGTVISRIEKMEENRIIKGYSVILDEETLGYDLTVISEITISKGKLIEVEKEVKSIIQDKIQQIKSVSVANAYLWSIIFILLWIISFIGFFGLYYFVFYFISKFPLGLSLVMAFIWGFCGATLFTIFSPILIY